jgi:hypothetical protein
MVGLVSAKNILRSWVRAGAQVVGVTFEDAETAGELLVKMPSAFSRCADSGSSSQVS